MNICKLKDKNTLWYYKAILGYVIYKILKYRETWEIYNPEEFQELVVWNEKRNCSIALFEDHVQIQSSEGKIEIFPVDTSVTPFLQTLVEYGIIYRSDLNCYEKNRAIITDSIFNEERIGYISKVDFPTIQKLRRNIAKFSIHSKDGTSVMFGGDYKITTLMDGHDKFGGIYLVPWLQMARSTENKKISMLNDEYLCFCSDSFNFRDNSAKIYYHYESFRYPILSIPERFYNHISMESVKNIINTSGGALKEDSKIFVQSLQWRSKEWKESEDHEMIFIDLLEEGTVW